MKKTLKVRTPEHDRHVREVLDAIRRIVRALRIASRATERAAGLSGAQLFVLSKLADGKPVSVNEVAARTLTHQSSVSVVVQRLARRRLVKRTRSADDARRLDIVLTDAGRRALQASPDAAQAQLIDALAAMRPARRKALAGLLEEWLAHAGFAGEPATLFFENDRTSRTKKETSRHVKS